MMKNLYILLLLALSGSFYAQVIPIMQNANWAIGSHGGLNFNFTTPQPFASNIELNGFGAASVSDQNGALLFYTDGKIVWNADNTQAIMSADLWGEGGDYSQNIVIIPDPSDVNKYYIVTISIDQIPGNQHGLRFSRVETINGAATVTDTNTPLRDHDGIPIDDNHPINYGKITSARHANGLDYWLIAEIGPLIYSYLVNDTGITLQHTSNAPLPINSIVNMNGMSLTSSNGPMKISPDNSMILIGYSAALNAPCNSLGRLYEGLFNDANGNVSNFAELNCSAASTGRFIAGAEFSPDGNTIHRLYDGGGVVSSSMIYDPVSRKWIEGPITDSQKGEDPRILQRAIDNRIYFENTDVSDPHANYIGVIQNPNAPPYDFQYNAADVGSTNTEHAGRIPTWVQWQPCHRFLTTGDPIAVSLNAERLNWIKATNKIDLPASDRVIYHAGDFVELNPGFETQSNSGFVAYIEGCTDSYVYRNSNPIKEYARKSARSEAKAEFVIYPNPSNSLITIDLSANKLTAIVISSMDGKVIQSKSVNSNSEQIDVSGFTNGMYLITVQTDDGRSINSKFIKN
jgi:hypothetical protein